MTSTPKILKVTQCNAIPIIKNSMFTQLLYTVIVMLVLIFTIALLIGAWADSLPACQQGTHTSFRHQTHQTYEFNQVWRGLGVQQTATEYLSQDSKITSEFCIIPHNLID